jgi:hypothetical protein
MIDAIPEDWKHKWIADTPGGRFGETYELKGVSESSVKSYYSICATMFQALNLTCPGLRLLCIRCVEFHDGCRYRHRRGLYSSMRDGVFVSKIKESHLQM